MVQLTRKNVTLETRENSNRRAKDIANANLRVSDSANNGENSVISDQVKASTVTTGSKKNPRDPLVKSLAEDKDIDLEKHFKNRIKYSLRTEFFEVDKSRGSKDRNLQKHVTINVQTGLFEAMKKSLVRILTDCLCLDLSDEDNPKVDLYGSLGTELKYQIYVKYKVEEKTYKVKIDLHNTTCVLGVYGVGNNNSDKVEGKSVAGFFVEQYLLKVVDNIKLETDIIELNKKYRELAKIGLQNLNKKKQICFECEKEVKDGNNFKSAYCKKK